MPLYANDRTETIVKRLRNASNIVRFVTIISSTALFALIGMSAGGRSGGVIGAITGFGIGLFPVILFSAVIDIMKRRWVWALLLGLLLGTAAGLFVSPWLFTPPSAEPSTLFRNFAFQESAEKAGQSKWEVLEDKVQIYPLPFLDRPKRIERRIVARASFSKTEFLAFFRQFDSAVEDVLKSKEEALVINPESLGNAGEVTASWEPQAPRFYQRTTYQIGDRFGVLEAWLNGQTREATAMVRLTESHEPSALPPAPSGKVNWKRR